MTSLETLLADRYDVGVLSAPVCAVLWAAEAVAFECGAEAARKQLARVNRRRERMGVMPAYPAWGTPLFGGAR